MPATTQVKVIIDAKDNASSVLSGLGKQFGALGKSADNLGSDLENVGKIALAGVAAMVAFATKAAFSAARVEELTFALHAIAKANKLSNETVDDAVASLREMNIAHNKALQITSKFVTAQLDLTDAIELANTAKDLAVVAGMDSSEATDILTDAILTQFPIQLRQFGIVKSLDQIYGTYAETIGKAAKDLTDLEKRQAFLSTILEEGKKVAGTYDAAMGSVSKRFRSLTGRIIPDFMAKIGQAFSPALTAIIDAITEAIKGMGMWMDQNTDQIATWGEKLGQAMAKGIEIFKALVDFVMNNKEILVGIFAVLAIGIGALAVAFISAHAVTMAVIGAIIAIVTLLAKAWNENFLGIQTIFTTYVENMKHGWEVIQTVIGIVIDWFSGTALPAIIDFLDGIKVWILFFVAIWQLQWAIVKDVVNIVVNWFKANILPDIQNFFTGLKFAVSTFAEIWGVIWANVKKVIDVVVGWFMTYVYPTIEQVFNNIKKAASELRTKVEDAFNKIKEKVESVINFIRDLIDGFKPRIKIGIDLPNIEEAWRNLKQKAHDIGVPGFQTGGIVSGPIGAPVPILAHGGERITPAGVATGAGAGGGEINFYVNVGLYAGTETEKRNIARDLYAALVQVARSQDKNVMELMGG